MEIQHPVGFRGHMFRSLRILLEPRIGPGFLAHPEFQGLIGVNFKGKQRAGGGHEHKTRLPVSLRRVQSHIIEFRRIYGPVKLLDQTYPSTISSSRMVMVKGAKFGAGAGALRYSRLSPPRYSDRTARVVPSGKNCSVHASVGFSLAKRNEGNSSPVRSRTHSRVVRSELIHQASPVSKFAA